MVPFWVPSPRSNRGDHVVCANAPISEQEKLRSRRKHSSITHGANGVYKLSSLGVEHRDYKGWFVLRLCAKEWPVGFQSRSFLFLRSKGMTMVYSLFWRTRCSGRAWSEIKHDRHAVQDGLWARTTRYTPCAARPYRPRPRAAGRPCERALILRFRLFIEYSLDFISTQYKISGHVLQYLLLCTTWLCVFCSRVRSVLFFLHNKFG